MTDSNVDYSYTFIRRSALNPHIKLNTLEIGTVKNQAIAVPKRACHAFPAILLTVEGMMVISSACP